MSNANPLAAQLLESSVSGYASAASVRFQQAAGDDSHALGGPAQWKAHLTQRILELAAAVRVNEPRMFARRISWLRRAMQARGADESRLRTALESLKAALAAEFPKGLQAAIDEPIELALKALDAELEPMAQWIDASTSTGRLALEYLTACLEADTHRAIDLILEAIVDGTSPHEILTQVFVPAQREIGELWHVGDVTIAEERLVSETTREAMTLIVHRYAPDPDENRKVIAASVAGNAHDLGLRVVADLFRLNGWRTIFLGADVPAHEITRAAQSFSAVLIVLSATLTTQLAALASSIEEIKRAAPETKVLIGGQALQDAPDLWRQLGADGYASDVSSAVEIGRRLIDETRAPDQPG
jgi:methanogenic corrinoid protein MtbC1